MEAPGDVRRDAGAVARPRSRRCTRFCDQQRGTDTGLGCSSRLGSAWHRSVLPKHCFQDEQVKGTQSLSRGDLGSR